MALINCPECKNEISNKAESCPHCGCPIMSKIVQLSTNIQSTEITEPPMKAVHTKKKIAITTVTTLLVLLALVATFRLVNASMKRTEYLQNLNYVQTLMLDGGAKAEELCNLTKSVWNNTIRERHDSNTDPYTISKYTKDFHSDFNTSLQALYLDSSTKDSVDSIKASQEVVATAMLSLHNPSDELTPCYETVNLLYDSYLLLTNLAISPSGNLTTYAANFNTYDTNFMMYFNKLKSLIPEHK